MIKSNGNEMSDIMKEIIIDTLIDAVKLIPFLFLAFLIIELIEHKFNKETKKIISKSGNFGPLIGSIMGLFPQCGFSVMATNLYTTRIITYGTLIAIYLSTSDEMLPIMLSNNTDIIIILQILSVKFLVGIIFGFLIDFIIKKKNRKIKLDYHICEDENCHCEKGIVLSSLKHTFNIILFIIIITFILNIAIYYLGDETIEKIFMKNNIFGPFISSLIGLIPNCASSVIITELYLNGVISFGTTIAGLLTGSGVAILVLFKSNKDLKENFKILLTVYGIGSFIGILVEVFNVLL